MKRLNEFRERGWNALRMGRTHSLARGLTIVLSLMVGLTCFAQESFTLWKYNHPVPGGGTTSGSSRTEENVKNPSGTLRKSQAQLRCAHPCAEEHRTSVSTGSTISQVELESRKRKHQAISQ